MVTGFQAISYVHRLRGNFPNRDPQRCPPRVMLDVTSSCSLLGQTFLLSVTGFV